MTEKNNRSQWSASGWQVQRAHVPGSRRMLAIWAFSLVGAPVLVPRLAGLVGLRVAMLLAVLVGAAGLVAGVAVYLRASTSFTVPDPRPWPAPAGPTRDHRREEVTAPRT